MDREQNKALSIEGSVAIIAGPGSGKTRVLVEKSKISPPNSLALTFTRTAAGEIKQRAPSIKASTIHSFCYKILKKFPGDYDLLLMEFLALENKPKFDYILVDEFQDLNKLEVLVIKSIMDGDIFLVGDPYQSIYEYSDSLGLEVLDYFSNIKRMSLVKNYRSNDKVVKGLEKINKRGLVSKGPKNLNNSFILFRTNQQLDKVAGALYEMGYKFNVKKRKGLGDIFDSGELSDLTLMTIHCSKGLEAKNVAVFDWGERYFERNLEYVAFSRAAEYSCLLNSLKDLKDLIDNKFLAS